MSDILSKYKALDRELKLTKQVIDIDLTGYQSALTDALGRIGYLEALNTNLIKEIKRVKQSLK